MKPKFFVGQNVVITKSVVFLFEDITIRAGEIGRVVELDYFVLAPGDEPMIDYVVKVGERTLFFYAFELAAYPTLEG